MEVQKTTLSNGLRVLTAPMPSMESATVEIIVDAGSRDETGHVNGLAHFLEHMVFKGTKKYPSAQTISAAVDAIGAEINANTHKERTAYFIKAWEKHLQLAFDILSGFIKEPLLKSSEIEREKGVILEERAMYEDLPMQRVEDIFENLIYRNLSLGMDIIGTKKSIKGMKRQDFVEYRERFYRTSNMVLSIAGKFNREKVLGLAREYFDFPASNRAQEKKRTVGTNPTGKPEVKLLTKKTEQAHLVLGVRANGRAHKDRYVEALLAGVLGGGMSSRLWTQIRERRGLAYYVRTNSEHYTDNGELLTRAGIKIDKVYEAAKIIVDEYGKLAGREVPAKELTKAKEFLKGKFALSLEDTHAVADFYADDELFEEKLRTPEEIIKGIDAVTTEDVQRVAREFFQNNRLNLAVVGPFENTEKFKRLLKL